MNEDKLHALEVGVRDVSIPIVNCETVLELIADYRAKCEDATVLAATLKGALEEVEGLQRSVNSYAKAVAGMPSAFD